MTQPGDDALIRQIPHYLPITSRDALDVSLGYWTQWTACVSWATPPYLSSEGATGVFVLAIDRGAVRDRAEVARRLGLTRARVTQLLDLTLLAPDIQEQILFAESADGKERSGGL